MQRYICNVMFASAATGHPSVSEVSDLRALRALAHPFRVKLYELVAREGTLTATQASGLTGESSASCSFHLRQLAKYGFLEAVPQEGGRERPWRRTSAVNVFDRLADDPDYAGATEAAGLLAAQRLLAQLHRHLADREHEPPQWREASLLHDSLLYLTAAELSSLKQELLALAAHYQSRTLEPGLRPADSKPVAFFAAGFPLPQTPNGN